MNEVIAQLHARKSVRAFTAEPVSAEDERAILEAACQAPTGGNQQPYTIIVARSQELKDALAISCDHQPFIARAPLVLVFCADVRRWYQAFVDEEGCDPREPGLGDLLLAMQDATIAAQNAVVAAESLGLGSCYIGDIMENCEEHRAMLGLPEYVMPAVMLVIGHPTQQQKERRKPKRFPLEAVVVEDRFEVRDTRPDIADKLAAQHETIGAFCTRKWNSGFAREMTRSVRAWEDGFPYAGSEPVPQQPHEGAWDERAQRVAEREADLVQVQSANARMAAARAQLEEARAAAERLAAYADSGQWLADYEADEAGELPAELRRGVLSQDALHDALADFGA